MRWLAASGLTMLAVGWALAIGLAPVAARAEAGSAAASAGAWTYAAGALICHQQPARSFHVDGVRLPVCARCAGLYWGGAAGIVGWLTVRARRRRRVADRAHADVTRRAAFQRALVYLGAPIVISVATATAGVWDPGNVWRALVSAPFGAAVGAALAAVTLKDLR